MAHYYISEDGKIKKGKEKESTYTINSKGKVVKNTTKTTTKKKKKKEEDIAPVKKTTGGNKNSWFKSGGFSDGVTGVGDFFGDLGETILGTVGDVGVGVGKGITRMGEGIVDLGSYGVAEVADKLGKDKYATNLRKKAIKDWTSNAWKKAEDKVDKYSILGNKSDGVTEGLGQVLAILGTGGLAGAAGAGAGVAAAITTGATGLSSMGSGMSEAYRGGASDKEAFTYGAIAGTAEAATELLFGGLGKSVKALGLSKGLSSADDMLAKKISSKFTNQIAKNFTEFGIKAGAEGTEEVLSGIAQAVGKKVTYMSDKELSQLIEDEDLLDQFIVGSITSGIAQSGYVPGMTQGSLREANKSGTDFISGLSQNEQKVVDKEYENRIKEATEEGKKLSTKEKNKIYDEVVNDLEKGYISTDTIESAIGGKTYETYKNMTERENAVKKEIEELENKPFSQITVKEQEKLTELRKQLETMEKSGLKNKVKSQLSSEVSELALSTKLSESYNEQTRRSQAFQADITKYDAKQQDTIKKATESGILNNSNRTHEFVDLVAKISADKGVTFDFTNNKKLKESGFAVEGKTVNGYVKDGNIAVNIDSNKSLNSIVGHEITHTLEGTEHYNELQQAIKEYAKTKGEYFTRRDEIVRLYNDSNVENVNIGHEVTADLVGDYLFTDKDFINNLSTEKPNIFKRIYDEIKYLCKIATAGSKEARQLEKVKRAFDKAYKESASNTDTSTDTKVDTETSPSDNIKKVKRYSDVDKNDNIFKDGWLKANQKMVDEIVKNRPKTETDNFKSWFGESKAVNQDGEPLLLYHGTDSRFTKFASDGKAMWLSTELLYAREYSKPIKKSDEKVPSGKVFGGSIDRIIPAYIRAENPADFGNTHLSFEEALSDVSSKLDIPANELKSVWEKVGKPEKLWQVVNSSEMVDLLKEHGFDSIKAIEDTAPTWAVFESNQIKSAVANKGTFDNKKSDIRFSLSKSVEETKDLIAVHNMSTDELAKSLELGGLPMPSIAIIKAKQNFDKYGDVSLILNKDSIDPKKSKDNKVYGGDAWTPVYPTIEYKPNDKVEQRIKDKYSELSKKLGYDAVRPLQRYVDDNLESSLNRDGGEDAMLQKLYNNIDMMQLYLEDSGKGKVEPITKEVRKEATEAQKEMSQWFVDKLGEDVIRESKAQEGANLRNHRIEYFKKYSEQIKSAFGSYLHEKLGLHEEDVKNAIDKTSSIELLGYVKDARVYLNNGGVTITVEPDYEARTDAIKEKASDGYKEWIDSLFKGVEEKTGIRNNTDTLTRSGTRRSWDALHWENTLENVIKVMKSQDQTGADATDPSSALFAASQKKYKSIDDIKSDSNRLGEISEEEYKTLKKSYSNRLIEIANSIKDDNERNPYIAMDSAANLVVDAVRSTKTKASMLSYLQKWNNKVTAQTVDDIISLVSDIASMPTGYFEAKPQRAVGLDEVGVYVIPYNADAKLKQELLNKGYSIAEYNPDVEGDRQRVVNQFEDYKFSLSNREQITAPYGNYNVYGKDVALKQDFAPTFDDIAPLTEEQANTRDAEQSLDTMPADDFEKLVQSYMDNAPGFLFDDDEIRAWAEEQARENPQGPVSKENIVIPESPLADRDIDTIGRQRKTNAYMYENPEVKPFFQDEALSMLLELQFSTPGERHALGPTQGLKDYDSAYEGSWGTKRDTSEDLAYLRDTFKYDKDDLLKGLNAIIEDDGAENNAISKRIEFVLDNRLRKGYNDFMNNGKRKEPNLEYINLLNEKQITEYNDEARSKYMQPDIAPLTEEQANVRDAELEQAPVTEPIVKDKYKKKAKKKVKEVIETPATKLENAETEIANLEQLKQDSYDSYTDKITKLQNEYEAKKNKDTKVANNILRRIERLSRSRADVDADYSKRLENANKRKDLIKRGHPTARSEVHRKIMDNVKAEFSKKGYDFDKVLENAKNLSTFATVDNTPQRVMNKALGYKEGNILSDITVNKIAQNESEGIKWLDGYTNRKTGVLAQLVNEYKIKPGSKESAAAQMYAEGFYVDDDNKVIKYGDAELAKDFPNEKVRNRIKGLASDPKIRQIYDDTLNAINDSRLRNVYPEIPKRKDYFLHFRAMDDTFSKLGLPFNPNDIRAKDLPTDLNGVTADLEPGQPYFASAKRRMGKKTSHDLLGGLERYLTSAKNQIYHIDDIQNLRALRNYIADKYGQAHGLEDISGMTEEEFQERIAQVYNSHLSTFAKFLNEEANVIAGKTSLMDRGLEGLIGRRALTFLNTVNKQVGSNMVGLNVSSAGTNFLPVVETFARTNKADFFKAFTQTASNKISSIFGKSDGFMENNPTMLRRNGADVFYRTPYQKVADAGQVLMGAVDNISTELIVRTKYNEYVRKGMSHEEAVNEADKWASRTMGDRSLGQQPQLFNSKAAGLITKFQLEVRNLLDSQFYDTIQESKASNEEVQNKLLRNAKTSAKMASTFTQLAIAQHLFGTAFEKVVGYNPAFDVVETLIKVFGFDDEEDSEDTVLDNIEQGFLNLLEDLPYASVITGGGRIPISSALPIKEFVYGEDEYGEKPRGEILAEALPYYLLPTGYGQIKKTVQGLSMFDDDLPISGSYTESGSLRFPIEDTTENKIKAGLFGQWANENARTYFNNDIAPLKEKQIKEFIDVDMPINDYWEYREGLKEQKKLEDKFDYIDSLDLPTKKKNILINNIVDRKEDVDMENYGDFSSYEEFDFYSKYPEKHNFLMENNVSYKDYSASEESRDAYNWAFNNPEKYTLSKAISKDVVAYRDITKGLYEIRADKDSNGKTIVGSAKEKKIKYINSLDIDYGERLVLFKSEYNADDTYNYEIIDYLNSREDITYEEQETILKQLGFTVTADGNIYWD